MGDVGVLIFVHQDELEALLVLPEHVGMFAEQPDVFQQEIAEIGGVEDLQPLLVEGVELAAPAVAEHRGFARRHLRRRQPAVLPAVDQAGQHPRRPALVVDIVGLQQLLQEPDLVVDIEHGEVGLQLHQFGMDAQDAAADGVEGAEPWHAFHRLAEHLAQPQLHLARRLVGEGDREDFAGPGTAEAQNMGDAAGQYPCFAGARAGQHQHRAVQRFHRRALLGIEASEILRHRRRPRARRDTASGGLVGGDALLGQLVRLGHAIRLPPTMAPRGREGEPS